MKREFFLLIFTVFITCKNNYKEEFYSSGELKSRQEIKNGLPNGKYVEFYKSGNIKLEANYHNGKIIDSVYLFHNNGKIEEKGLMKNGRRIGWWSFFDVDGSMEGVAEYIIDNKGNSYKNQMKFFSKGLINFNKSSFFDVIIPDTLELGKNMGMLKYYSPKQGNRQYLKVVVNNQYSDNEYKKDTFSESFDFTRFGVFAHKKGVKNLNIEIIEQIVNLRSVNKDSSILIVKNYKKYFSKEIFVK